MPGKNEATWLQIRFWCRANPGKRAMICTPDGNYIVQYEVRVKDHDLEKVEKYYFPSKGD